MISRPRAVRFELSSSVYDRLQLNAEAEDMGVNDLIRRIVVNWSSNNPPPQLDEHVECE